MAAFGARFPIGWFNFPSSLWLALESIVAGDPALAKLPVETLLALSRVGGTGVQVWLLGGFALYSMRWLVGYIVSCLSALEVAFRFTKRWAMAMVVGFWVVGSGAGADFFASLSSQL